MILYTPEVLYAVIAHYNATVFPAQLIAGALALTVIGFVLSGRPVAARLTAAIIGTLWLWCGLTWFGDHYETINWAGYYYAIAFAVQGGLLIAYAVFLQSPSTLQSMSHGRDITIGVGVSLAVFALAVHPLIEWAMGKGWAQAQYVGASPDATVVFSLGLLAAVRRVPFWLLLIPLLWLLLSGGWSLLLGTPDRLILPALGLGLVMLIAVGRRRQVAGH